MMTTLPMIWGDEEPRARFTDPITSHEAAASNGGTVAESRAFVADMLRIFGSAADHELVARSERLFARKPLAPHWTPQRLRTARNELTRDGIVTDTGIYRLTPSGRRAKVWTLA